MFLTKRSKDNRRKEIELELTELNQMKTVYEQVYEEFKNKYLPVQDKCIETILDYNLGRYPLRNVFSAAYEDGKLRLLVTNVEEIYWDADKTLKMTDTLVDETIQMDTLEDFMRYSYVTFVNTREAELIANLKSPLPYIKDRINGCTFNIINLEKELDKLNK